MERLEAKTINGHTYYYYSVWGWVDGKCRRIRQKYLGKLQDLAKAVEGGGPAPLYAEVFQWGLPTALWRECGAADVIEQTDIHCPKRDQGLSAGEYLAIAAINRAICPRSKRSMGEWFARTALLRHLPQASKAALASQRFWDHMARIQDDRFKTTSPGPSRNSRTCGRNWRTAPAAFCGSAKRRPNNRWRQSAGKS